MLFPYFKDGTKILKNNHTPPGLIKPWAKSPNSKVNREFNLGAKNWGIMVPYNNNFKEQG